MKNYIVKAIKQFNDTNEKQIDGTDKPRIINDIFKCTKERYEFLEKNNAVVLMKIEKQIGNKKKANNNGITNNL